MSQRMCLDTEEFARRSAIYASLADSMVAFVIKELSSKDERTKLLREKLAVMQEAQVAAVSAGFAATSHLQLLPPDALLKNFGFQPQVLCTMRTVLFEGSHVLGHVCPETLRLSQAWKRRRPGRLRQGHQSSTVWGLLLPPRPREQWHRSRPFVLAPAGKPANNPIPRCGRSLASLLQLPQPDSVDGSQVGARLADFAPHWQSLLGNCRATGIVEDGVGITFQQRPQLTHQCISFRTWNSRQDLQQAVDALLLKGAIERVTNVTSLGYYSRLFLVPKKTGDLRTVIDLSTLNRHMVVPHFKTETQGSVRSAIRSQEWTVSIDIRDAYLHVPMHQAVGKYLRFVVNKQVYQFTCLPFGLATLPW